MLHQTHPKGTRASWMDVPVELPAWDGLAAFMTCLCYVALILGIAAFVI